MNKLLLIVSFLTVFLSCSGQHDQEKNQNAIVETIEADAFKALLKSKEVQLVDVRTLQEVEKGKIEGAINIDYLSNDFQDLIADKLDKDKPVAVYCAVGGRSARAAKLLSKMGFTKVYDLKGGYNRWEDK
ncbi:MAG: rhodanese-like domain-containing protein [Candidatus Cyclobacteriaceae bacterium M2_1C_046]